MVVTPDDRIVTEGAFERPPTIFDRWTHYRWLDLYDRDATLQSTGSLETGGIAGIDDLVVSPGGDVFVLGTIDQMGDVFVARLPLRPTGA